MKELIPTGRLRAGLRMVPQVQATEGISYAHKLEKAEARLDWTLPQGVTAGELRYPVPTRLTIAGLMNYVYERDYAVLVRLKVPPDADRRAQ